jgi:hypothetical protein
MYSTHHHFIQQIQLLCFNSTEYTHVKQFRQKYSHYEEGHVFSSQELCSYGLLNIILVNPVAEQLTILFAQYINTRLY